MSMSYLRVLNKNPNTIGFGFLNAFFAGLGQTHFISIFNPIIMATFALSHSEYGSIYSLITLISGTCIVFIGPLIDRYDLRYFCLFIGLGFLFGLLQLFTMKSLLFLGLGLFGLRFFAHGLSASLSSIAIARHFEKDRGKALGLSQMGYPFYEVLMTPLFAFLLDFFKFQNLLILLMLIVILIYLPLGFFLTATIPEFNKISEKPAHGSPMPSTNNEQKNWTRKEVFKNKTIYFLLVQFFVPPFTLTGLFFHQAAIAQSKGWSLSLMASGLIFFGFGRVVNTFITGSLVDKYRATNLFPFYQIPLCLGFFFLTQLYHPWAPALCFLLFGFTVGSSDSIIAAIMAELYGVKYLGALKSLLATFMIFSTAAAPVFFGYIIETGEGIFYLLNGVVALSVAASLLSFIGLKLHFYNPPARPRKNQ